MNKTIEFKNTVVVQTWTTHFFDVSKIVINKEDVCIDIYNSSNQLMGAIYYRAYNKMLDVWIEDYKNNKTYDLVEGGELNDLWNK